MFLLGLTSLLLGIAEAAPVLVPDFTTGTAADSQRAEGLYLDLLTELQRTQFEAVDGATLSLRAGGALENCANSATCVPALFEAWPAPLAIVGAVTTVGDRQRLTLRLYLSNSRSPNKVYQVELRPGEDWTTVHRVSSLANALMVLHDPDWRAPEPSYPAGARLLEEEDLSVPEDTDQSAEEVFAEDAAIIEEVEVAAFLEEEDVSEPADPLLEELEGPQDDEDETAEEPDFFDGAAAEESDEEENDVTADGSVIPDWEDSGIDPLSYRFFVRSGLDLDEWVRTRKPHTGPGNVELHLGMSIGDVMRTYDQRVAFADTGEQLGIYESDVVANGQGQHIALGFGIHIGSWAELSFLAGLQNTTKYLDSGWQTFSEDADSFTEINSGSTQYDPVSSIQGILEPRFKAYLLPYGPLKVYGLAGAHVSVYDEYEVPDQEPLSFPGRHGVTLFGWLAGAGMLFDAQTHLGIFAEVTYVGWISEEAEFRYTDGISVSGIPGAPIQVGYVIRPSAGIQYRF